MAYVKQEWHDLPLEDTPISADRLTYMENGIYNSLQSENISTNISDTGNKCPTCETVKDYVDGLQTYSTEETVIGTWIDGKPIYRKSFYFTQWSGLGLDTSLDNIDNIINASVTLKNSTSGQWMKLAFNPDSYYAFYIKKTGNTHKIFVLNNSSYTADAVCSFIEYTKTTDV